jgi:uncharacterized protein (DUF697 family)
MDKNEKEATACMRVLVAVARADGAISAEERTALEAAFDVLPGDAAVARLLDESPDFEQALAEVTSDAARETLFQSAYGLIHADGEASAEEKKLLDRMRAEFKIDQTQASVTERLLSEAKDTVLPSNIVAIADPARRQKEIEQDVLKYSVFSAVLGAFPVPGLAIATDLAIVALQVKLIRDIGQYWGHTVDREAAKTLLAGVGLGTGARIAVSNLAKLVPVWGSAFGATTAFATTWALGRIANRHFEGGQEVHMGQLRKEMRVMEKAGKEEYARHREAIEARKKASEATLSALSQQRKAGTISQAEYEKQVAALAG